MPGHDDVFSQGGDAGTHVWYARNTHQAAATFADATKKTSGIVVFDTSTKNGDVVCMQRTCNGISGKAAELLVFEGEGDGLPLIKGEDWMFFYAQG